jgi:SSS family solute:Na+ symporter
VTKYGACAGIVAGIASVMYITITETTLGTLFPALPQIIKDTNVGVISLFINLVVLMVVSLATKKIAAQPHFESGAVDGKQIL